MSAAAAAAHTAVAATSPAFTQVGQEVKPDTFQYINVVSCKPFSSFCVDTGETMKNRGR